MEDSSPPTPELPERKNRLSSNSGIKRNKVSRACDECRKRKVRCDGAQPCARCQKSTTECIFSNVIPKRGPPKKYLEQFETRLKSIDTVLHTLELSTKNIDDDLWKNNDSFVDDKNTHLDVSSIGRALYILDNPLRIDRIEPVYNYHLNSEPPQPNTTSHTLRSNLIQAYFDHIHPSMPFISQSSLAQSQPPVLLLYAVYAVASKFVPNQHHEQQKVHDPPGWYFYKMALDLVDIYADTPRLSTVQAFLLLAKYHEFIYRPGFFSRTKFFVQLAVRMSNDLGLSKELPSTQEYGLETRRRTFWAVHTYEVLMSAEQGFDLYNKSEECSVNYPDILSGEDPEPIMNFHWLSKVIHTLALVIEYTRHNHDPSQFTKIEGALLELGASIPQRFTFTHLIYHLTIIFLYRPKQDDQHAHSRCMASATYITQIVDHIIKEFGVDSIQNLVRGNQQIIYCLSAAMTVLRSPYSNVSKDIYEKTCAILQLMIQRSPVTELSMPTTVFIDRPEFSTSNTSSARSSPLISSQHSPNMPTATIRKRHSRSSLQFPISDTNRPQTSSTPNLDMPGHHRVRSASRSHYANNRLSAPALGSLYEQSPYYLLQQQQQQQFHANQQIQQQPPSISSYSQPPSPTTSQFSGSDNTVMSVFPRRTTSMSRKTGLRRSASSTGEFIVPSQRARTSTQPYINPRRHTVTNTSPPDLSSIMAPMEQQPYQAPVRSNRFSAPVMSNNTHHPYMIPITYQQQQQRHHIQQQQQQQYQFQLQQQQQQQQQMMMMDPSSFPMDPVIPDSPSESMMGLLLNNYDFSQQQQHP